MKKTITLVIAGMAWLGTVVLAYFLGTRKPIEPNPASKVLAADGSLAGAERFPSATGAGAGVDQSRGSGNASVTGEGGEGDVTSIIRKAKLLLSSGGMMNISGMVKVGGLLESIPFDRIPEALAQVKDISNPQAKQGLTMMLLSRWAEKDGADALQFAEDLESESGSGMLGGGGAKMVVLQTWGQHDPEAVWDWYVKQKDSGNSGNAIMGGNSMALMGVFGGLVARDPEAAFERLATVDDTQGRQMALGGMMQHIADPAVQKGLASYLDGLPAGIERTQAMAGITGQWAMLDPDSMMEFADSRPEEERRDMLKTAGQMMLWSNPEKGTEMLLENSAEKDLPSTYQMIVSSLASRDPKKAETWLAEQPQGAELDQARSAFAQSVARSEPERAMTWAKEVVDEKQREAAVGTVYRQWRQTNEEAANASLPESGLSPEAVKRLLDQVDAETGSAPADTADTGEVSSDAPFPGEPGESQR